MQSRMHVHMHTHTCTSSLTRNERNIYCHTYDIESSLVLEEGFTDMLWNGMIVVITAAAAAFSVVYSHIYSYTCAFIEIYILKLNLTIYKYNISLVRVVFTKIL